MSEPAYDFEGQVALVTGASSGMRLATARAFALAGATVVLADANEDTLRAATDDLTTAGHTALDVTCDVSHEAQVAGLVDRTVASFGRLDMAFNNAGIMIPPSDAADEPADNFDRVNAINLDGAWACMKHELRQMREQGSGAIVNCSSLGGLAGLPGRASYHASKHGVLGLNKSGSTRETRRRSHCRSHRLRAGAVGLALVDASIGVSAPPGDPPSQDAGSLASSSPWIAGFTNSVQSGLSQRRQRRVEPLWSPAVATGGNRRQMGRPAKSLRQTKNRCRGLRPVA
jgi:NAD(P)-dependent dehydrogenase (short-subunit alcohol dehydrogenase family)